MTFTGRFHQRAAVHGVQVHSSATKLNHFPLGSDPFLDRVYFETYNGGGTTLYRDPACLPSDGPCTPQRRRTPRFDHRGRDPGRSAGGPDFGRSVGSGPGRSGWSGSSPPAHGAGPPDGRASRRRGRACQHRRERDTLFPDFDIPGRATLRITDKNERSRRRCPLGPGPRADRPRRGAREERRRSSRAARDRNEAMRVTPGTGSTTTTTTTTTTHTTQTCRPRARTTGPMRGSSSELCSASSSRLRLCRRNHDPAPQDGARRGPGTTSPSSAPLAQCSSLLFTQTVKIIRRCCGRSCFSRA